MLTDKNKNNRIRKAVLPVAGLGTRFLPATKAMPKELLPIINKPLIQYAAEEAVAAGIDTLIFITGRNKRAIEDHFDHNYELEFNLRKKGDIKQADSINNILAKEINCIFIRQSMPLGLGHAIACAESVVGREPFAVLLADDFIVPSGKGVTSALVRKFEESGASQLAVQDIKGSDISNYGVVIKGDAEGKVFGLVEKPKPSLAPSSLASIGRYILKPEIFDLLKLQKPGVNGEIQLADAIHSHSINDKVQYSLIDSIRFDCGSVKGYCDSIEYMAKK